jgi:hypothetical protein
MVILASTRWEYNNMIVSICCRISQGDRGNFEGRIFTVFLALPAIKLQFTASD